MFVGSFYLPTNILLIAFFNYYYTFLQLDPDDVSEQLKRQGASIPLVRPGKSTAAFLKTVIHFSRIKMSLAAYYIHFSRIKMSLAVWNRFLVGYRFWVQYF